MRLIDANKVLPLIRLLLMNNKYAEAIVRDVKEIIDRNTIEAEPVVRCKDCIYWTSGENECDKWEHCTLHNIGIGPHSFCSYGERKEGADNG